MPGLAQGPRWWRRLWGAPSLSLDALHAGMPEVGDRFYEVAPPHAVWRVDHVIRSAACAIPHVVIERSGTLPTSKIISVAVLLDDAIFRRDRREGEGGNKTPHRRRKSDLPLKGGDA
ncbi:MAG: hypothetical protein ACOY99_05365 [Pseudomonadota bacterium]|jgi:hypothetical protein